MSSGKSDKVVSLSGSPVLRHDEPTPWTPPQGEECLEAIDKHIEIHLGRVETVFHEILSDTVHIDIHFIKPSEAFPFNRLVTSGMSDLPMTVPENARVPRFAELMITLPKQWQLDQESFRDENWYWPIRLLKDLARLPHKYTTWLAFGHTIPNGDPAEPYSPNTSFCGAIVLPSATVPEAFHTLRIDEAKEISFYSVIPLFEEEMRLKLRDGSDELLKRFDKAGINDIVDPGRRNVAKRRLGIF